MIKTLSFGDFCDSFSDSRRNTYSYNGKRALFDYLESLEDDCGTPIECDIIAICCDFTEYENFEEIQANYTDLKDMDDLRDHTQVIEFDGGIIIQNY